MAVAGAVFSTVMLGLGLTPPALMRRMYCGRRNTPCASAPVRSASSISSATLAASASGTPTAVIASSISAAMAAAGTRAAGHHFTPASSFCTRPLSIVSLSSSPHDSALTCRAHSKVPMS